MDNHQRENIQVIEYLTVAMHFCAVLEQVAEVDKKVFVHDISRIMPLLYLKGLLIPETSAEEDESMPQIVTQEDYEMLCAKISHRLKDQDLLIFVPVQDETEGSYIPVSEMLSDIYQDAKNFVINYPLATEDQAAVLVSEIKQSFHEYWGTKLLLCQQAIHKILLEPESDSETEKTPVRNTEDWIMSRRQKEWGEE
ncbi:MAG: hypothetical protein CVU05_13855 [Bacteroidetes bacterium HGW-Bacteroidetes-21]|jgi:hypothetical protein|nr:MAG: hypothetical protein CVU05_13855 [Bacteroidetes bacterium HGW-Bacteroidetes-21]